MKKVLLIAGLYFCSHFVWAQSNTLQDYYNQAREAHKAGDYPKFYKMILEAQKLHPYHQGILYQSGIAAALNNNPEEAIRFLNKAIHIKADYDLATDELKSLRGLPEFEKLKTKQAELQRRIVHSDTAFIIKDRSLHLESVAAGESKNIFYLGSIHKRKIVRVNEKGIIKDFTSSAQDGLCSVFGIKVDRTSNVLWACSSPMAEMENFDSTATSGVYKYDIKSGKLLARFTPDEKKEYVFGDLTLAPDGKVFISDSKNNIIFIVNESTGKLDNYFNSKEFWNLQGLTFTEDGRYLFIADYIKGLFRLDTKDRTLIQLTQQFDLSIKSIDGLTYYNHSLIGIQNSVYPMRVTQYLLNAASDQLVTYRVIDSAHPAFNEPTIGCLVKDTFYYVANSLWSGYSEKHELKPADQLQDVVILKANLKNLK